jgi:hypothetical protein
MAMGLLGSQLDVRQALPSGALAYEDLVAQYSQAVAEASAAALAQSSLSKMVCSRVLHTFCLSTQCSCSFPFGMNGQDRISFLCRFPRGGKTLLQ